jgi:UDP-2,3-diacylglucosamine pyrophosphatase LpxH
MQVSEQFNVGLLTDMHYDGSATDMNRLYSAVATLNRANADMLVVMGDLVNGNSATHATRLLREVSALCESFREPIYYMPGNHDLDYLSKEEFYQALGRDGQSARFELVLRDYRFVSIDGNFSADGSEYDRGNFQWENACVPEEQLQWLRSWLDESDVPVVLFSHQRIDKDCTHAVGNNAAVREVISASGKVKVVLQGHQHEDDLLQIDGTAYYTLSAFMDDAGPAMLHMDAGEIRLTRDFQP